MPANHCIPHTAEARAKISAARKGVATNIRPMRIVAGIQLYRCSTCKAFLPRERFYSTRSNRIGIKSQCVACHSSCSIKSRDPKNTRISKILSENKRRALKAGSSGNVSRSDLMNLDAAYGGKCLICSAVENLTWDHVIPLSKGGKHCISNLQKLCRKCNEKKQARTADYRSPEQVSWCVSFKRVQP